MNLIQITEQLKNPAISVPQLMQYANNSNPQVPSYVALAEMQRRQSMQTPPQAPQQTVKDQLGASLMGLPSVAPGGPQPGPQPGPQMRPQPGPQMAPQPVPQPVPQPQQEMQQPPSGAPQAPMPQPRQAAPTPGMAGGGLTSIPLNMHHDFAAGGIIAFAQGGEPDPYALKKPITEEEAFEKQKAAEAKYGFGNDPYAEAKRRYAALEAKQAEREKNAGLDRFFAGLAAYGSAGPKGFAQAAGNASKVMQGMESQQQAESDARAAKMAELHTLFAKEQEAMNRARYAAVRGMVKEEEAALHEVAKLRQTRDQVKAQETSAGASLTSANAAAQNSRTLEEQRKFEQGNYPREMALKEQVARAQLAHANKLSETEQRIKLAKEDPNLYARLYGEPKSGLTEKDVWEGLIKNDYKFGRLPIDEQMRQVREAMAGKKPSTTGGTNPYSTKSDAELKAALGIK
jgi:hypothetical protein